MAFTSHGHQIPGTTVDVDPPRNVKRCGGTNSCNVCKSDVRDYMALYGIPKQDVKPAPKDLTDKAKQLIINYVDSKYSTEFEKPDFEVYVAWFVKVLQHWKAMVFTDRGDGRYYELIYNGDKHETYLHELVKIQGTTIQD